LWVLFSSLEVQQFSDISNFIFHGLLTRLLGVRASTPTLVVLAELGRFSLVSFSCKTCMWGRLVLMAEERLVKKALNDSIAAAGKGKGPS
jgi:hypothetical protein